jgi:hypothetical protein
LTSAASRTNENAESARPNSSAYGAGTRPAATGRERVRLPISRSMSASSTWFSALAPPQARPSPSIVTPTSQSGGKPPAPTIIPQSPVSSSSDMIRGFVSVT